MSARLGSICELRIMSSLRFPLQVRRPSVEQLKFAAKTVPFVLCISAMIVAAGCAGKSSKKNADLFAGQGSPKYKGSGPLPKGGGRYHVGKTYTINGVTFHPKEVSSYEKVGVASWYGPKFHRRMTSNGEWFDMHDLTAAHPTLPLPSYVKVTNLGNGKEAVVRVNDRGPFAHNRIIDLSKRTSEILGFKGKGTQKVRVVYIGRAPLAHDGTHLNAMNRKHLRSGDYYNVASAMDYGSPPPATQFADAPPEGSQPVVVPANFSGRYFVQAASFSNSDNAERAKLRLGSLGPVEVSPVTVGYNTFYRVRVGPLDDSQSAYDMAEIVREQGMPDARIVTD